MPSHNRDCIMRGRFFLAVAGILIGLPAAAEEAAVPPASEESLPEPSVITKSEVYERLVTIHCETPSGLNTYNGSVVLMDGAPYVLTCQSFLLGADRIIVRTRSGRQLRPSGVELSPSQDLVRLPLQEDMPGLHVTDDYAINTPVFIPEASQKRDKIEDLEGEIIGIGPDVVEISAAFDPALSGAPVLSEAMELIGLTSHVILPNEDWVSRGTAFESEIRRFCCRVAGREWIRVNWRRYNAAYGSFYLKHRNFAIQSYLLVSQIYDAPYDVIPADRTMSAELVDWIKRFNKMVMRQNSRSYTQSNAEFAAEYAACIDRLQKLCRAYEQRIQKLLEKERLTEYLRTDFEMQLQLINGGIQGLNCINPH